MVHYSGMNIDAIILAAGLSTRMGCNKLLLPYKGKAILQHTIDLVAALPFHSYTLVSREETLAGLRLPAKFRALLNPAPESGQSSSMRLGLAQAGGDGFIFFQGDQPLLDEATVRSVLALADENSIVVPRHGAVPGNPVFFPGKLKAELMAVEGDRGGRSVRDRHAGICKYVDVPSPAPMWDVDTREKYEILLSGEFPPGAAS